MPRIIRRILMTGAVVLLMLSVQRHPSIFHGHFDDVRSRALWKLDSAARYINPRWHLIAWVPAGWMALPPAEKCVDDIQYLPVFDEFLLPETVRRHFASREYEGRPGGTEPGEPFNPIP